MFQVTRRRRNRPAHGHKLFILSGRFWRAAGSVNHQVGEKPRIKHELAAGAVSSLIVQGRLTHRKEGTSRRRGEKVACELPGKGMNLTPGYIRPFLTSSDYLRCEPTANVAEELSSESGQLMLYFRPTHALSDKPVGSIKRHLLPLYGSSHNKTQNTHGVPPCI
jgi:hypothetical protein